MKHKLVRIAIGVLAAFIALSAIGGGIVMLARHLPGWRPDRSGRERPVPAGMATQHAVQRLHHSRTHTDDWRRREFAPGCGNDLHKPHK